MVQQDSELTVHVQDLEQLEKRISTFDKKLTLLYDEMRDMKERQEELINIIKQGLR